jgi:hypothetical protein
MESKKSNSIKVNEEKVDRADKTEKVEKIEKIEKVEKIEKAVIKIDETKRNINYSINDKEKEKEKTKDRIEKPSLNQLPVQVKKEESKKDLINDDKINNDKINLLIKEIEELKARDKINLQRIQELEEETEREREVNKQYKASHQRIIDEKTKELKEKDKAVQTITVTNSKLMQTLDELKKEVDEHFDKVSVRQITDKIKKSKEENKQNPLEIVVKVKEKELKNANHLMEILRKDNEQLQKNLDNYGDFNSILQLQDKLKVKEKEVFDLNLEIKTLTRSLEEHKKCSTIRKETENEIKILKDDYKAIKEGMKMQQAKMKDDEKARQKTVDKMINLKKELDKIQKGGELSINNSEAINKLLSNSENKKVSNLNHDPNIAGILQTDDKKENLKKNQSSEKKLISIKNINANNSNSKTLISRKKLSIQNDDKIKLFTSEEKIKLENILPKDELEKYEKKFEALDHSKQSIENKLKSDLKQFMRKITDQEGRLDFLSVQLKEAEQKCKINALQINEYKNEQRAYQRKLNETQAQTDSLYTLIREKDQENKILINQLSNFRKIVKHNAVPPMDIEITKHLEKMKNEESNMNSFNNELNEILAPKQTNNKNNMFITGEDPSSRPINYNDEEIDKEEGNEEAIYEQKNKNSKETGTNNDFNQNEEEDDI